MRHALCCALALLATSCGASFRVGEPVVIEESLLGNQFLQNGRVLSPWSLADGLSVAEDSYQTVAMHAVLRIGSGVAQGGGAFLLFRGLDGSSHRQAGLMGAGGATYLLGLVLFGLAQHTLTTAVRQYNVVNFGSQAAAGGAELP